MTSSGSAAAAPLKKSSVLLRLDCGREAHAWRGGLLQRAGHAEPPHTTGVPVLVRGGDLGGRGGLRRWATLPRFPGFNQGVHPLHAKAMTKASIRFPLPWSWTPRISMTRRTRTRRRLAARRLAFTISWLRAVLRRPNTQLRGWHGRECGLQRSQLSDSRAKVQFGKVS